MVGVPGRSKACNTCRQRKVACSLEKPECQICIKASRVCGGYQRERVFILGPRTAYQGPKDTKNPPVVGETRKLSVRQKRLNSSKQKLSDNSLGYDSLVPPIAKISALSPNVVYRQQILSEYLASTLLRARGAQNQEREYGYWLKMLPALPERTTALERSIMAVCTANLGRLNDDQALIHESLNLYVQALRDLQKALWDPNLMHENQTLAACISLVMYEVVECPDKKLDGWLSHMKGCSKMFELKGPNAYGSDFGHQLFLSFRIIEIQQAIVEKRHTFLADKEWLLLPFKDRPKSIFQQLLDLVVMVPNIIADGYRMLQAPLEGTAPLDPSVMLQFIVGLVDRCWKVDSQLQDFYAALEEATLGPVYWPELSTEIEIIDAEAELGKVFPVSFKFLDMQIAHICVIYWATNCILWSGMAWAYQLLPGLAAATSMIETEAGHFDMSQIPPLEHRKDVANMAKNICQSVEFVLSEKHRGLGARSIVFPLKVAIETLHDARYEREVLWAKAAMGRVNQKGVRIMKHIPVPLTDHAYLPG